MPLPLLCIFMTLATLNLSAGAHASTPDMSAELREALFAFVDEEIEGIPPELREPMVECILPIFDGIQAEMLSLVLAEEDMERGLGIVLTTYPEREAIMEECEKLLD